MEDIMSEISAEQKAEQDRLISYGKLLLSCSSENEPRYDLRARKRTGSHVFDGLSKPSRSETDTKHRETQPLKKRSRMDEGTYE